MHVCMYVCFSLDIKALMCYRLGKLEFGVQVLTTGHWPQYKTVVRYL